MADTGRSHGRQGRGGLKGWGFGLSEDRFEFGESVATRSTYTLNMRRHIVWSLLAIVLIHGTAFAQGRAELPWWDRAKEARCGAYLVRTDLPADEADRLAHHLNVMYAEYSRRLASLPPRAPEMLNVYIFSRYDDYLRTLRARFGVAGEGSGGMFFITAQGSGLAFWTADLPDRRVEHVIQHEGFHQFAFSRFGGDLPLWVNEGLAEFFGQSVLVNRKLILGQSQKRVIDAVREAIETDSYIPFRDMLTMSSERWLQSVISGQAGILYEQAWSMVHFLVYGDNGQYVEAFERYLRLLNEGVRSEDAFVRVFGPDVDKFEERWKVYANASRPSAFMTAMERLEFLAAGIEHLAAKRLYPVTLDELQSELKRTKFTLTLQRHGVETTFNADDPSLFVIPADDLANEEPSFTVVPFEPKRLTRRERMLEDQNPTPPGIRTESLKPRRLELEWVRDRDTNTFRYRIIVR